METKEEWIISGKTGFSQVCSMTPYYDVTISGKELSVKLECLFQLR